MSGNQVFAKRVRELRETKGMSQEGVASLVGYTKQAVQQWENSGKTPRREALHKLASYFLVSLDWLLGYTDDRNATAVTLPPNKKTKDLDEFLRESDIMFKGTPLSDDAKDRLRNILVEIDGMAREMNRRKKP